MHSRRFQNAEFNVYQIPNKLIWLTERFNISHYQIWTKGHTWLIEMSERDNQLLILIKDLIN